MPRFTVDDIQDIDPFESAQIGDDYSRPRSALHSAAQGLASIPSAIPKVASELAVGAYNIVTGSDVDPEDNAVYRAGQAIDEYAAENFPTNRKYQGEFATETLPGALGSTVGFLGAGLLGRALRMGSAGPVAATGFAAGAQGQIDDYLQTQAQNGQPVDPSQRLAAAVTGGVVGLSEAVPIERLLQRMTPLKGERLAPRTLRGALEEGSQEYFQNTAQNVIASDVVGYDPNRDMHDSVAEGAAAGGLIGAGFNALLGRGPRRAIQSSQPSEPRPVEERTTLQAMRDARKRAEAQRKSPIDKALDSSEAFAEGAIAGRSRLASVMQVPEQPKQVTVKPDQRTVDLSNLLSSGQVIQGVTAEDAARAIASGNQVRAEQAKNGGTGDSSANMVPTHAQSENAVRAATAEAKPLVQAESQGSSTESDAVRTPAIKVGRSQVFLPDNTPIETEFRVVDAAGLVSSHTPEGTVNPDYPKVLQPRDRSSKQSRLQVERIARQLNPNLLGDAPAADMGAPIIDPDTNVVESGNGRLAAITRAYQGEKGAEYRKWLKDNAEQFGLDPAQIDSMERPVLVRARLTKVDPVKFTRDANRSNKLVMTPAEQAFSDASEITDDMLADLRADSAKALASTANKPFVQRMLQVFGDNEAGSMFNADGTPNNRLLDRLQNAVFAKAYNDERLVAAAAQGSNPQRRNLLNALLQVAPVFARLRTGPYADLAKYVVDAAHVVYQADTNGVTVEEHIQQVDALDALPDAVARLALAYETHKRSGKAIAELLTEVAKRAREAQNHQDNGADMFGDYTPPTAAQIIEGATHEIATANTGSDREGRDPGARPESRRADRGGNDENQGSQSGPDAEGPVQQIGEDQADFRLEDYTEDEIRQAEAEKAKAEAEAAAKEAEAQKKARADSERDAFVLTGSDRAADEAEARGQMALFEGKRNERKASEVHGGERDILPPPRAQLDMFANRGILQDAEREQALSETFHVTTRAVKTETLTAPVDRVTSRADAVALFSGIGRRATEGLYVAVLDADGKVLEVIRHSTGSRNSSQVFPIELVGAALERDDARTIWLAHNHPSGNAEPSSGDIQVTENINRLLDGTRLSLAGHVIVGSKGEAAVLDRFGGDLTYERYTPADTGRNIEVTERVLERMGESGLARITSPSEAAEVASKIEADNAVILLDQQHDVVAVIPLRESEARALRAGSADRILKATSIANSKRAIIKASSESVGKNIVRLLNRFPDFTSLDIIVENAEGKRSLAEAGENVNGISGEFSSRTTARNGAISSGMAQAQARLFLSRFKGAQGIKVDVATAPDRNTRATYDPDTDTLTLYPENIGSAAEVHEVMRHEILVHKGLGLLPESTVKALLDKIRVAAAHDKALSGIWDEVQKLYPEASEQTKAEEVLARIAESNMTPVRRAWNTLAVTVNKFLRALGLRPKHITRQELMAELYKIGDALREGIQPAQRNVPEAASRVEVLDEAVQSAVGRAFERAKDALLDNRLAEAVKSGSLAALTLRQLAEVAKNALPQIQRYRHIVDLLLTRRNQMAADAADVIDPWIAWARKNRQEADALADLMHEATLAQADPAEPYVDMTEQLERRISTLEEQIKGRGGEVLKDKMDELKELRQMLAREPERKKKWEALRKKWDRLSPEAHRHYIAVREAYRKHHELYRELVEKRILNSELEGRRKREMIAQLRAEYELSAQLGPYFPLARFGEYWVKSQENGEYVYRHFETAQAQKRAIEALKEEGVQIIGSGRLADASNEVDGASLGFVNDLVNSIKQSEISDVVQDKITDEVYQMYLRHLPSRSMRKNFIHRKGIKGFSQDAIRAFADVMMKDAYQLSRYEYEAELTDLMLGMQKAAKDGGNERGLFYNEMVRRHQWVMNPQSSPLAQKATAFGFVWMLGVSPAAAIINLTQTFAVGLPVLASKFGLKGSAGELVAMSKLFRVKEGSLDTDRLSKDEAQAYVELRDRGVLDSTRAHDLAGIAENESYRYSDRMDRAMRVIAFGFHRAEQFNRDVTALAAYRLARKQGINHAGAVEMAADMTWRSHFDYTNVNRARFMQNDFMKVATQFRQYSQQMTYYLFRNLYVAMRKSKFSKEERREAVKQLLGTIGATAMMGGVNAMPFLWMAFAAAELFWDDDDDPFDARAEFYAAMADTLGKEAADWIIYGAGGASLSGRISLDGLWLRDPNRDLEGQDLWTFYAQQMAGPVFGGVVPGMLEGARKMGNGQYYRGVENMVPKFVKDVMRVVRYADEGALSLKGDPLKATDDFSFVDLALQGLGFFDSDVLKTYAQNSVLKNYERRILDRRKALVGRYYLARVERDHAERDRVMKAIKRFNSKNPEIKITMRTLMRSLRARERMHKQAEDGIHINKRLRERLKSLEYTGG